MLWNTTFRVCASPDSGTTEYAVRGSVRFDKTVPTRWKHVPFRAPSEARNALEGGFLSLVAETTACKSLLGAGAGVGAAGVDGEVVAVAAVAGEAAAVEAEIVEIADKLVTRVAKQR